jgi:hypothetical protein
MIKLTSFEEYRKNILHPYDTNGRNPPRQVRLWMDRFSAIPFTPEVIARTYVGHIDQHPQSEIYNVPASWFESNCAGRSFSYHGGVYFEKAEDAILFKFTFCLGR